MHLIMIALPEDDTEQHNIFNTNPCQLYELYAAQVFTYLRASQHGRGL